MLINNVINGKEYGEKDYCNDGHIKIRNRMTIYTTIKLDELELFSYICLYFNKGL